MFNIVNKYIVALLFCVIPWFSYAEDSLSMIQHRWAECQYQIDDNESKVACLEALIMQNQNLLLAEPNSNEKKVWLAINLSSLAGAKGGLGALSLVKKAKALLEDVIHQQPEILDGSAYTSLGSLYYQVPGWPIGFGSDKKAEENLKKAIAINPMGIDSHYFYGDFLMQDGRKAEAEKHFKLALSAPARPGRDLADRGRREEIIHKLKELSD